MKFLIALFLAAKSVFPEWSSVIPIQTALGSNFCTAFSISKVQRLYATAAHCVNPDEPDPRPYLDTLPLTVVYRDPTSDIAVVRGPIGRKPLRLATVVAGPGDRVYMRGYPFGWELATTVSGMLAYPIVKTRAGRYYAVFDMTAAGGNSGSPVLNERGEVISILQVGFNDSRFTGGPPQVILVAALRQYWEGADVR